MRRGPPTLIFNTHANYVQSAGRASTIASLLIKNKKIKTLGGWEFRLSPSTEALPEPFDQPPTGSVVVASAVYGYFSIRCLGLATSLMLPCFANRRLRLLLRGYVFSATPRVVTFASLPFGANSLQMGVIYWANSTSNFSLQCGHSY